MSYAAFDAPPIAIYMQESILMIRHELMMNIDIFAALSISASHRLFL